MAKTHKVLTLKQRFAEQLKAIKGEITEKDRGDYLELSDIAKSTLSTYLNGNVYDLDRAADMLKFFSARIKKREQLLKANA